MPWPHWLAGQTISVKSDDKDEAVEHEVEYNFDASPSCRGRYKGKRSCNWQGQIVHVATLLHPSGGHIVLIEYKDESPNYEGDEGIETLWFKDESERPFHGAYFSCSRKPRGNGWAQWVGETKCP